jgi:hypothetical protein
MKVAWLEKYQSMHEQVSTARKVIDITPLRARITIGETALAVRVYDRG